MSVTVSYCKVTEMADSKEDKSFNIGEGFPTPFTALQKIIKDFHVLIMPDQVLMKMLLSEHDKRKIGL